MLLLMVATAPAGAIGNLFSQLGVNVFVLFVGFLLPHGIFELPAAIFATAAATQVGTFFILPPNGMSIGRSLQFSIVNYIKLLALVIPLLLIAGIIEANITPAIGCWLTNGKI
jgi:stage II sporulation protein M